MENDRRQRAFFSSLYLNQLEVFRVILTDHPHLVHARDARRHGHTPLAWACQHRRTEFVRLLLQHGADVNARDKLSHTALWDASWWGYTEIVQLLLAHGADMYVADRRSGILPLHIACIAGHVAIVREFLEHMSVETVVPSTQETPLLLAVRHADTVKLLLEKGANVHIRRPKQRDTPLMLAASLGSPESVRLLIQAGARINEQDFRGYTALMHAVQRSDEVAVRLLLQHGARWDLRNNAGQTAVDVACRKTRPWKRAGVLYLLLRTTPDSWPRPAATTHPRNQPRRSGKRKRNA